ncbi:MAG: hypothetical protein JSV85_02400 [Candidatus Bathyarchaeota archaeon]|nr:MAG: hypothetical protein JSV85_02400 [Candidatus Bathyarchaeota archaeon]
MSISGIQFKMQYRIVLKFKKAGATSRDKAVTVEEADLDLPEQLWLNYFTGEFLGGIRKTKNKRYYI